MRDTARGSYSRHVSAGDIDVIDVEDADSGDDIVFDCRLPADADSVTVARHRALEIWHSLGASEDQCLDLDIALGEALGNAVRYGNVDGSANHTIHVSLWRYGDSVITMVADRGPGFDPPCPPYAMPPAIIDQTRGRGLPLMETLTDAFLIARGDAAEGGASVFLVKRLK